MSPAAIVLSGVGLLHLVTANAGVAASQDDTYAIFLPIEVLLGEVAVGQRIAHDDQGITLVDTVRSAMCLD